MTSGSKTTNLTSLATTYDQQIVPPGPQTNVSQQPVGFYWTKSWNGSNYPATPLPDLFSRYWQRIDIAADNVPQGTPRYTYLDRWLLRKARPRRAYQVEHPYTCSITMWSDALHQYKWTLNVNNVSIGVRNFQMIFGTMPVNVSASEWNANDTIALRGKLRQRIVGSDFNLAITLGESPRAIDLITSSATRIAKSFLALKRGDLVSASVHLGLRPERSASNWKHTHKVRDRLEHAADKWLELRYGWMPLVNDAYGATQALAQQLNNPAVQTYRARMRKPLVPGPNSPNILIRNGENWGYEGETRAQLIAKLTQVNRPALNGLTDPLSLGWELLPYSFVADWFIPIGSYLQAVALDYALTGTFVETLTRREKFHCYALRNTNSQQQWTTQPFFRSASITVTRTVSTTLNTPRPQFKTDTFRWQRAVTAIALMTRAFKGVGR